MKHLPRAGHVLTLLALCGVLSSCAVLGGKPAAPLRTYTFEAPSLAALPASSAGPACKAPPGPADTRPVLLVEMVQAAPGYESKRMVYTRQLHTQETFANSTWADTPARMLAPMLVERLQHSGQFRAVVQAPSAAKAALRLDTTILQLQQDFLQVPSRVHYRVQVTLLDNATREVMAWRVVDIQRIANSNDAAGGALAAYEAVQDSLQQVLDFLQVQGGALPTRGCVAD